MGASIELAKADYTRVLERNHQLQAAQERLSLKIDEQKDRITLLEKGARLAKDSLTYKDLEIAGLKIGIDKHKSRINQLEEQVLKLEEELRVATSAVAPPKATPKKRVGWSSSLS
jgi:chromosome segregation ATPase